MNSEEIYKDKEYCLGQLMVAREAFGNKNTTREQYDQIEKCLAMMYLYCPEEIHLHVLSTLGEADWRKKYYEENIWKD